MTKLKLNFTHSLLLLSLLLLISCSETKVEKDSSVKVDIDSTDINTIASAVGGDKENQTKLTTDTILNDERENFSSVAQVYKRLKKKANLFVVKTNRDTVIKCAEGTLLSIPANAFINPVTKKEIVGDLKISVKEFYSISDMISANLTTTSNKQLIETGGMLNIKVVALKDSCVLKPGKNISIAIPTSTSSSTDRMQLFYGTHDTANINWKAENSRAGLALRWRFSRDLYPPELSELGKGFIFHDNYPSKSPRLMNDISSNYTVDIKVPLRDFNALDIAYTKNGSGYIDTSGSLVGYKVGNTSQTILFEEIFNPTIYKNLKVNVPVEFKLSYKSDVNVNYYQKLFKMGKGNPDSLITVTACLNKPLKIASYEKIKIRYKNAITVSDYLKKQKHLEQLKMAFESKIKNLKLDREKNFKEMEVDNYVNSKSAQDYLLMSTSNLGWINCDRFYNQPNTVDFFVKLKESANLLIVFKNIKSIIPSDREGGFRNVPLNEPITIVGLKTEKGKLMMAFHETKITKVAFEKLEFKPITFAEYKSNLQKLNRL